MPVENCRDTPWRAGSGSMEDAFACDATWAPPAEVLELASLDSEILTELLDAFAVDADARIEFLGAALAAGDATKLRAQAHALKGGAQQLGADDLASLCQELESAPAPEDSLRLAGMVGRIQASYRGLRAAMACYSAPGERRLGGC